MVDWKELQKISDHFGLDGLIADILNLAEGIRSAYERERALALELRPVEEELGALDQGFLAEAASAGKNESQRKAILAQLRAESTEYEELRLKAQELKDQIEESRNLRAYQHTALNARRSVCYLIGSILDACKAYRYYNDQADQEEPDAEVDEEVVIIEDGDIPF